MNPERNTFDEVIDAIDEAVASGRLRMVFWVCPKGCRGCVSWSHSPSGQSIPRCEVCGETGSVSASTPETTPP